MTESVFRITDILPKKEDYGLTSQLRRAALIVSGNIAKAFDRYHVKDTLNFYCFSGGSIIETMSHLEYGLRVGYFKPTDIYSIQPRLDSLYISINRLIKSLKIQFRPQSQPQPEASP